MKAKIWNHSEWAVINPDSNLKETYTGLLKASGFKILGFIEHHFDPQGYTALWLLGESHFAIHTFPEENKYYIELTSCNEDYLNNFKK